MTKTHCRWSHTSPSRGSPGPHATCSYVFHYSNKHSLRNEGMALTHILEYSVLGRRVRELATTPLQLGSRENTALSSLLPSGTPVHGDGWLHSRSRSSCLPSSLQMPSQTCPERHISYIRSKSDTLVTEPGHHTWPAIAWRHPTGTARCLPFSAIICTLARSFRAYLAFPLKHEPPKGGHLPCPLHPST